MAEPFLQDPATPLIVTITQGAPDRLDKALARSVPEGAALSRTRLVRMILEGAVCIDGAPATDPKAKVAPGQRATLHLPALSAPEARAEPIPLRVVYEDAELIVIDKPAGMVVHPGPGNHSGTLVNALLFHCRDSLSGVGGALRPGIVHRIDKDTSGLLVTAKSDRAHHALAAQFERHSVTRRYLALVQGVPDAADARLRGLRGVAFEGKGVIRIATQIARHRHDRQRQAVTWSEGRRAVTRLRVCERFADQAALIECWLETGRTHQIRVHMAYAGFGLVGDATYGGRRRLSLRALGPGGERANRFPRQALHAASLGFEHPVTGARLEFTSDMPEDMADLLEGLRGAPSAGAS